MAAHCGPIPLSAFGARVGPSPFSSGPMQEVMRQPGAHVLAAGVPPMATLPLAGIMLSGKITLRGGLQSRPASASWQGVLAGRPFRPCFHPGITLTLTDGSTVTLDQAETRTAQRYAPFAWAPLRAWLLEHVREQHAPPGEWDVSITPGSMCGIDAVLRLLL